MNTAIIDLVFFLIGVLLVILSLADIKFRFISNRGYKLVGIVGAIWFVLLLIICI